VYRFTILRSKVKMSTTEMEVSEYFFRLIFTPSIVTSLSNIFRNRFSFLSYLSRRFLLSTKIQITVIKYYPIVRDLFVCIFQIHLEKLLLLIISFSIRTERVISTYHALFMTFRIKRWTDLVDLSI
jgi:hypothetical protein